MEVCTRRVSLFCLAGASQEVRLSSKGGEKARVQVHARKYGRAVYHGVSALPHKSHDTGPPLISLFNLRVRNNYV